MIMPLNSVICLYAQSADLRFLNPVRNRMAKLLGARFRCYELSHQASHAEALLALKQSEKRFVVIFAHGSADYLRGGEFQSRMTGESVEIEKFLTRQDLTAFEGKVVFCMSCDSNGLAKASLDAGAIAFVGFDKVPFNRFDTAGNPIGSKVLVKHSQEMLAESVTAMLERFLSRHATLDEMVSYLRLWISKTSVGYVRKYRSVKERREIAALLLQTRQGVLYHGLAGIRFERES